MLRILVHIGFHKTATSLLQNSIFSNEAKGFASPWTVRSGEAIEHFVITHDERFDAEKVRSEFLAAIQRNDSEHLVNVISHEDLCGYPVYSRYYGRKVASRIRRTFPEAKILIGIREQKTTLRSLYSQYIRQDGEWPLAMFIGTGDEDPGFAPICRLDHLEYHLLIKQYFGLFGKEQVLVLPYELLRQNPIAFENQIHRFADTGARADAELTHLNVGLGALTLAVQRRLNRHIKRPPLWKDYESLPLSCRAKDRFCRIFDRVTPRSWHERENRRLELFIESRTAGYYRESNRELSELLGIDLKELGYDA